MGVLPALSRSCGSHCLAFRRRVNRTGRSVTLPCHSKSAHTQPLPQHDVSPLMSVGVVSPERTASATGAPDKVVPLNCRFISLRGLRRLYGPMTLRPPALTARSCTRSSSPSGPCGIRPQQVVRPRWPEADSLGVLLQLNLPIGRTLSGAGRLVGPGSLSVASRSIAVR